MDGQKMMRGLLGFVVPMVLLGPVVFAYAGPEAAPEPSSGAVPTEQPSRANPVPSPPKMIEEYAIVRVLPTSGPVGQVVEVRLPGGYQEGKSASKFRNAVQVLNRLAKDGWRVRTANTWPSSGGALGGNSPTTDYLLAREVPYTPPADTGGPDTGKASK